MRIWVLRMIKPALLALALAGSAEAGAWEEFEARCLVPMENVVQANTDGLALGDTFDDGRFWENRREGWSLAFGEREGLSTCTLFVSDAHSDALATGFATWVADVTALERYTAQGEASVQSTTWREPRIEVHFRPAQGRVQAQAWVTEVNIEA